MNINVLSTVAEDLVVAKVNVLFFLNNIHFFYVNYFKRKMYWSLLNFILLQKGFDNSKLDGVGLNFMK